MSDSLRTALLVLLLLEPAALAAQDDEAMEEELPRYRLGFEVRAHYRDSERARFPVPFPFTPEMLPPGQTQGFMETVEAGRHTDLSVTERVSDQVVTLPLWSFMDEATLGRVIDGVRSFFRA